MELNVWDLTEIVWESRWRHIIARLPKDAVVTKDVDGIINFDSVDGKFLGAFDLERRLFWLYDVHGPEVTLEPV